LLIYYFIRQSNYADISGTTVPIFGVAMNEIQKLLRYVRRYALFIATLKMGTVVPEISA